MRYPKNWNDKQIELYDELSDILCNYCDGSGEGYTSESKCTSCNGRGTLHNPKNLIENINNGEIDEII